MINSLTFLINQITFPNVGYTNKKISISCSHGQHKGVITYQKRTQQNKPKHSKHPSAFLVTTSGSIFFTLWVDNIDCNWARPSRTHWESVARQPINIWLGEVAGGTSPITSRREPCSRKYWYRLLTGYSWALVPEVLINTIAIISQWRRQGLI